MRNIYYIPGLVVGLYAVSAQAISPVGEYPNDSPPAIEINLGVLDKLKQRAPIVSPVVAQPVVQQPIPVAPRVASAPHQTMALSPAPAAAPVAAAQVNTLQAQAAGAPAGPAGPAGPPGPPGPPGLPAPGAPVVPPPSTSSFDGPVGPGATPPGEFVPKGYVEGGGDYHNVTNHFGNWSGEYLKGEIQTDQDNRWNAELLNQREFGSTGVYGAVGNTHAFDEDWYSVIDVGARGSGIYLPAYRVDAFINRKLLPDRQLVATLGLGVDQFVDGHKDQSVYVGGTYYFPGPWIGQAGIRFNNSTPGDVTSTSQFVAVTEGEDKHHFITLRYGWGEEAYQIIGPGESLSDFHSQQVSLEWRQWLGGDWGFNARGEEYHNPNYNRTGITLGVFDEF